MPIYDCACEMRFEQLQPSYSTAPPDCPECGRATRHRISGCTLSGVASAGRSSAEIPQAWRSTYSADREYITQLRKQWDRRRRLEERYPELQGDIRPGLSHEGPYGRVPLRVGDPVIGDGYNAARQPHHDYHPSPTQAGHCTRTV